MYRANITAVISHLRSQTSVAQQLIRSTHAHVHGRNKHVVMTVKKQQEATSNVSTKFTTQIADAHIIGGQKYSE